VFWDVGANVGVYSLYAAARRDATTLAFEPHAANYHLLNRNIRLSQLAGKVQAFCTAFAERTTIGALNSPSEEMGVGLSHFGRAGERSRYSQGGRAVLSQAMLGFSLDDFVRWFDPAFPNHLKIDVDDLEAPILRGGRETLRDERLRSLVVELSLTQVDETAKAIALLNEAGFELVNRGAIQGTASEKAANHHFVRRKNSATSAQQ